MLHCHTATTENPVLITVSRKIAKSLPQQSGRCGKVKIYKLSLLNFHTFHSKKFSVDSGFTENLPRITTVKCAGVVMGTSYLPVFRIVGKTSDVTHFVKRFDDSSLEPKISLNTFDSSIKIAFCIPPDV